MSNWLNKATIYLFVWCVYMTQGIILPKGSAITQLLAIALLLVSFYYVFVANSRYKLPIYFKGLNILIIMFSIYGLYLIIGGYDPKEYTKQVPSFNYLKSIYISLLPIYAFYVFAKEKLITEKNIVTIILFFFCLVTVKYFQAQHEMLEAALLIHSSKDEFTNNIGYSFLALIPACVYFYKRPLLQYVSLSYCMVFLLMGMKRGAILIGAICLVWLLWKNLTNASKKKRTGVLLLSIVLFFVGYSVVQKQMEESLLFQKRLEETLEGNTSRRDDLYSHFLNYFWNETSPLQFVFGSGANATLKISYNYAHNDWLEIAVNQGVLGIILYMFYWITFAKVVSQNYSNQSKLALQLLFVIYFMKTIFSMSYGDMTIPSTFILGYSLAQEKENEKIIYCS